MTKEDGKKIVGGENWKERNEASLIVYCDPQKWNDRKVTTPYMYKIYYILIKSH